MRPMRTIAALVTGLALTAVPAVPATASDLTRFHRQPVTWHGCQLDEDDEDGRRLDEAGAQCADVTVPLDYTRPGGRTLTVAISRLPASDAARRIGPLFLNLGGPGNPVLATVADGAAMGPTGARFDLIGMDPRFAGRSTPIDCGWTKGWLPRSAGTDRQSFDRMVRLSKDLAGRCARTHGDVLPHITTANIARDMDVVRAALGDPKLSYVGYSQGGYLGAVYAKLFPRNTDRIVLDSAIDPARVGAQVLRGNAGEREAALRDWAGWAAGHDAEYGLGGTRDEVLATVDRVYRASARRPLRVGPYRVDDTVLPALLTDPLTDDLTDPELGDVLRVLASAADGRAVQPGPELRARLDGLLTGAESSAHSVRTAILCADAPVSRDPRTYWRDVRSIRATAPLFGPVARTITPCAFWPVSSQGPVQVGGNVPALIVHADGDVNATLPMGQAMHRALTGSRMITLEGARTHGVYLFRGEPCVDEAVNAYLDTGVLPDRDLTC